MSQKLVFIIGRTFFLGIFALFCLVFVGWELVTLVQMRSGRQTLMAKIASGDTGGVMIGQRMEEPVRKMEVLAVSDDARPVIIKQYLEKYKSPLAPYSDLIFEVSQAYGFDYYWIVAIAQQESNLCKKIPQNSYNCWGYGIHSKGTLRFDGYETAIKSFAEYLDRVYFAKGLDTAELMMGRYCPHSNGSWAFGVNQFIAEMESGDF